MPSRAESPTRETHPEYHRSSIRLAPSSWTDDLPVCHLSGVGLSTNQVYREDGQRQQQHEFEDQSFHFKTEPDTYLYGVFDGHDGSAASRFAAQRMPAELLLGQLTGKNSAAEVKDALEQAFIAVEKGFFQSIDDLLAEKANLQLELPEGISPYQTYQQFPDVVGKLHALNSKIAGGTTAVVALIHGDNLYVANVGDSRAVLCRSDSAGKLIVEQLSVDHNLQNDDELLRLKHLNLDVEKIRQGCKVGNQDNTRCIGNYAVKGGYKDFDMLCAASGEPVIAEPGVCGGIPIDGSFHFLLLMSDGLYKALEEATGRADVNEDVAGMVMEQFAIQSTLMGVAQAVVDRVVRIHHDTHVSDSRQCTQRGDITLLVRNFNKPFPSLSGENVSSSHLPRPNERPRYDIRRSLQRKESVQGSDNDGRIDPYVDFHDFYHAVESARLGGAERSGSK